MAKYKVKVIIRAEVEYETEVEASSESQAEDKATGQWRELTPDDFQVSKGYITDWDADEVEQLTFDCAECGGEFPMNGDVKQCSEDDELCAPCGAKVLAELEAAK